MHPVYLALALDHAARALAYRVWLSLGVDPDDVQTIRAHLQQERALGDPRFQKMAEKTFKRPVALKARGRPRKREAAMVAPSMFSSNK